MDDVKDAFLTAYQKCLKDFFGDDAANTNEYPRIVNTGHTRRVADYVEGSHGGDLICGGTIDIENKYIEPTVILNPHPDSDLM
jgi:aldehyde dehydrogenase (NAD+)